MGRNLNKRKRRGLLSSPARKLKFVITIVILATAALAWAKLTVWPWLSWKAVLSPAWGAALTVIMFGLLMSVILLYQDFREENDR